MKTAQMFFEDYVGPSKSALNVSGFFLSLYFRCEYFEQKFLLGV